MQSIKRLLGVSLLVGLVWFASFGCTNKTKGLWEDKRYMAEYDEKIYAFYSNVEKNYLAIVGEKFHYIFDEQTEAFLALLEKKDFLNLQQKNLQINAIVNDDGSMHTDIIVSFDDRKLDIEQKKWLLAHKYIDYTYNYAIRGKRYMADAKVNAIAQKLKRAISLKIVEYKKEKEKSMLYKIAMTPLTVASDAAGTVLVAAGAVIVLPVGLLMSAIHE